MLTIDSTVSLYTCPVYIIRHVYSLMFNNITEQLLIFAKVSLLNEYYKIIHILKQVMRQEISFIRETA